MLVKVDMSYSRIDIKNKSNTFGGIIPEIKLT